MNNNTLELDYQTAAGLLSAYSNVALKLALFQQGADLALLDYAAKHRIEITELQEREAALKAQLELIARRHPEWFTERKSVVTPCGALKMTSVTKLEIKNEAMTIGLIEALRQPEATGPELPGNLVCIQASLNREAIETLSDAELEAIRVKRVTSESFSVVPAKANLGKAVAQAAQKATKQEATKE